MAQSTGRHHNVREDSKVTSRHPIGAPFVSLLIITLAMNS